MPDGVTGGGWAGVLETAAQQISPPWHMVSWPGELFTSMARIEPQIQRGVKNSCKFPLVPGYPVAYAPLTEALAGQGLSFGSVADAQFCVEMVDMGLDGRWCDKQAFGDLLVAESLSNEPQDLPLPWA